MAHDRASVTVGTAKLQLKFQLSKLLFAVRAGKFRTRFVRSHLDVVSGESVNGVSDVILEGDGDKRQIPASEGRCEVYSS